MVHSTAVYRTKAMLVSKKTHFNVRETEPNKQERLSEMYIR